MFYVEKLHRDNKKELAIIHIGPPIIVLLAFLSITVWSWLDARTSLQQNRDEILQSHMNDTEDHISARLNTYENILRSGAGLFETSNEVSRSEWKRFVEILQITERYPGVQGVGYAQVLTSDQLAAHEAEYSDSTYPNYSVHPKDERTNYTSIVYLEPKNADNDKAIGYDMTSDKTRRDAMYTARDSGTAALSDVVTLIQDQGTNKRGFLMYEPVYKPGTPHDSTEQRQKNIAGYVYAPFRSTDFFGELMNKTSTEGYAYQIYAGDTTSDNKLLYESENFAQLNSLGNTVSKISTLQVNNQTWTVKGIIDPSIVTRNDNSRPLTILWLGTIFSVFLAIFIYVLLLNRTRALSNKETLEIQNAKDELLALASHQLRTPATGVKQYLGLLREGYAGSLNKDQRLYINKAYESNERQLSTINEMLFVARSDAGNIKLSIRHIDITELMKDILEEQKSAIKEKKHAVVTNFPDHPINLYGDEQYLRMALENVVSNAIKYTEEKGKITISLSVAGNQVKIVVEDNGVGVNQADLPLLFRKFSRIPNELTSKVNGSGIGLYLTKSIVKAHNGTISFESLVNTGSSVTITLPSKLPKD